MKTEKPSLQSESVCSNKDTPIVNPLFANIVKIGKGNIFESSVEIDTAGGEIEIGTYNVFEAFVRIYNSSKTEKMIIGSYNYFEIKTIVNTSMIGNFNLMKIYSMSTHNVLRDSCVVGINSILPQGMRL